MHSVGFPPKIPNTNLVGNAAAAKYTPAALKVKEDTSGGNCAESGAPTSFTITNTGTKTAYVTFEGSPVGSLKKGDVGGLCIFGGAKGDTATLGLTNKSGSITYKSVLTITTKN
jgi:hypothetical protein